MVELACGHVGKFGSKVWAKFVSENLALGYAFCVDGDLS